jgi:protein-disulfide isomerase
VSALAPWSRRALLHALAGASLLAMRRGARAEDAPQPDSTVDMAKALKPGPLPELTVGEAAGLPVIEYGSATCPHCAHFDRDVWPAFKKAYVDTGKVRFIFREYSRNDLDVAAFMLARCLGDDKALAAIELLFATQDNWAFGDHPLDALENALRPAGLSHEKATECLKDQAKADAIVQIAKNADETFHISGTPSFIIGGKMYGGALSLEQIEAIVKPLVK